VAIGLHKGECLPRSQWGELGNRYEVIGNRLRSKSEPITYYLLPITSTPNSLRNLRDPIPGAIAIEWIERIRYGFTEDSAFWQSRVNAEFPDNVADGIIPRSWLAAARARYDRDPSYWDAIANRYYWQFGVDVADGGGDNHARAYFGGRSVLYGVTTTVPKGDYRDTMHLAGLVVNDVKSYRDAIIAVDNLGVGAGTLGRLLELGHLARACTFSAAPTRTPKYSTKYVNLRTQCYWEFREGLQEQEMAIAPLDGDEDLAFEELSAVEYTVNSSGTIVASSKDEVKKKIGRSPDRADAIVMAHWLDPLMRSAESVKVVSDEERLMRESKKGRGVDENLGRLNRVLGA
jgi:phage terminase large subunit